MYPLRPHDVPQELKEMVRDERKEREGMGREKGERRGERGEGG